VRTAANAALGRLVVVAASAVAFLLGPSEALAQNAPVRSIQQIAGDVYYFRNNNHYGIFTVTSEGVLLVDPIDQNAGAWLKEEIKKRFNQAVTTIVYSHHDGDHSGGAEAYKDTVKEIIAHENAPAGILIDDRVSVMPTRTFSGRLEVTLGNKKVELIELGPGHTNNLIAVRFPQERILFVVDIFSGKRLPFNGIPAGYDVDTVVGTLRRIEAMDFDIIAAGHTGLSNIAELVAFRTFLENLRAQVLQYRKEGKTVEEMKKLITMEAYKDWVNYANWLPLSIEGMNNYLAKRASS
jgi:glyoxylase-like metal-dependent hydrolase (beta-lactamase superfamily II)